MAHVLGIAVILGAGNTGLALTAALLNADGTSAAGLTTTTFVELAVGTGLYGWTGTIPDGFRGFMKFSSGATAKAAVAINPEEGEEVAEMHGLLGQNSGLRNAVFSGGGLTSYDLLIYSSSANALTNDGVTGVLHKYQVQNQFDGSGNLLTSSMVKVN
jgi:hypothetical protein